MRLHCTSCVKDVSSEVPDDTVVRALLTCPECYAVEWQRLRERFGERAMGALRLGVGSERVRHPMAAGGPEPTPDPEGANG